MPPARPAASLRAQLLRAFAVTVSLTLLAGGVGVWALWVDARSRAEVEERYEPLRREVDAMHRVMTQGESADWGYLVTGESRYLDDFEQAADDFAAAVRSARARSTGTPVQREVGRAISAGQRWWSEFARLLVTVRGRSAEDAEALARSGGGAERFATFRAAGADASAAIDAVVAEHEDAAAATRRFALATFLLTVVVGAGTGVVVARRTTRAATGPLAALTRTLDALAAGDEGARVGEGGVVEIRAVASAVNALADENARLTRERDARILRERAIRRIARRANEHVHADAAVDGVAADIAAALDVDRVVLHVRADERVAAHTTQWSAAGPIATPRDAAVGLLALAGGVADDVDPAAADGIAAEVERSLGVRALAVAPLGDLGVLAVGDLAPRTWTAGEAAFLDDLGRELAIAVHNARIFTTEQELVVRLTQLDQVKSEFVSSVSHELRTPLTSILGYVEMLRDGDRGSLTGPQDDMLEVVERNSRRLLHLIEDLLTLSRVEAGAVALTRWPVELGDAVRAAVDAARIGLADRDLAVVVDVEPGLVVRGDAVGLERIAGNLVGNAVKYTPDGGEVRVDVRRDGVDAVLRVVDTGVGIPTREQSRLFTRFFRSSISQELAVQGTGLGLAIVHSLVEQHGGTIAVDSAEGVGTTVTVTIPLATGDRPARPLLEIPA